MITERTWWIGLLVAWMLFALYSSPERIGAEHHFNPTARYEKRECEVPLFASHRLLGRSNDPEGE